MSAPNVIPIPPLGAEGIAGRRLRRRPRSIVVVRMHAFGDAVITLPALRGLRRVYPDARIDLVTSAAYRELFEADGSVDVVHQVATFASKRRRAFELGRIALRLRGADLLLDLQRNWATDLFRRTLGAESWVAFDRFAPAPALERYLNAIEWVGLDEVEPIYRASLPEALLHRADELLASATPAGAPVRNGPLVALNPAGCWPTKNWPAERYVELGERMVERWDARLVMIGTGNIHAGADILRRGLGKELIDLVDRTTTLEALALVSKLGLIVSDDSGLMHLAWTSGVPTIGLFGASRSTWSRPYGAHSAWFTSEDLECGACMRPDCARGDLLCLRRVSVGEVMEVAGRVTALERRCE